MIKIVFELEQAPQIFRREVIRHPQQGQSGGDLSGTVPQRHGKCPDPPAVVVRVQNISLLLDRFHRPFQQSAVLLFRDVSRDCTQKRGPFGLERIREKRCSHRPFHNGKCGAGLAGDGERAGGFRTGEYILLQFPLADGKFTGEPRFRSEIFKDRLDVFPVLTVQRCHPQRKRKQSAGKGKSAVRFFTDPAVFHETAQDPVTGACGDAARLRQLGMGLTSILLRQIFQKNDRLLDCRDRVFIFHI